MNASRILIIGGSALIGLLGLMHLWLTFFTNRFEPYEDGVLREMKRVSPKLTRDLSMWKAWIGFNGSHSSGIIFIAIMNCFLATQYFEVIQQSDFFFLFNIVTMAFYVFLAKTYWFSKPLMGASVTLACYVAAYVLKIVG